MKLLLATRPMTCIKNALQIEPVRATHFHIGTAVTIGCLSATSMTIGRSLGWAPLDPKQNRQGRKEYRLTSSPSEGATI